MPQRTRGHTTAAANPSPPASPRSRAKAGASAKAAYAPAAASAGDQHPLAPDVIARTLRAVADELERDPALAQRVAAGAGYAAATTSPSPTTPPATPDVLTTRQRTFRPRLVTGPDAALAPGIPDPFALRAERGEAGLRAVLEELRLGTLRAIIRAHHLDPAGRLARQNDAARLRAAILDAVKPGAFTTES